MSRKPWINVLIALVFLGIVAGVGWRLYDVGYDHGVNHQIAATATSSGASTVIVHDDYRHGHGFFPFFLIFPIGFFVLFFIVRPLLWRGRWGGPGGPGGMRQGLEEWHKQQHEKDAESR
jgi:hypothetical protein